MGIRYAPHARANRFVRQAAKVNIKVLIEGDEVAVQIAVLARAGFGCGHLLRGQFAWHVTSREPPPLPPDRGTSSRWAGWPARRLRSARPGSSSSRYWLPPSLHLRWPLPPHRTRPLPPSRWLSRPDRAPGW